MIGVELVEQRILLATFTVTNNSDSGPGSLRQAILDVNGSSGTNSINFNIGVGASAETQIPTAASQPEGITTGANGNLWFTEQATNKIGEITPSGTFTEFLIPTAASQPTGITTDASGDVWFTEEATDKIGELTTSGTFHEFTIPTSASDPSAITLGPDGNLWFTEEAGNKIGQITPSGTITEYTIPTAASEPSAITMVTGGNLWFTEGAGDKIGEITTTGTITEFNIPTAASDPAGITASSNGNLWFTESAGNKIGQITPTGTITEFNIRTANSQPGGITTGPDGNFWFTETNTGEIGQITPTGTITEFNIPTASGQPVGITAGMDGNLWFTEQSGNNIGRLTVTSSGLTISPASVLPTIGNQVTINGMTEPGVEINGGGVQSFDGLTLGTNSQDSVVTGLTISNFNGSGIHVESADDTITDDQIGTNSAGTAAGPGNNVGIFIDGTNGGSAATIGGTAAINANIIGFNSVAGVSISGSSNVVEGNFIGTNSAGANLGNASGISVSSTPNTIGGTSSGAANVIGFNTISGVSIFGVGNLITGNFIGTNSGGASLGNPVGVFLSSSGNTIGGGSSAAANIIGFNSAAGVSIAGASATGNVVLGNFIGTDPTEQKLGNAVGVAVSSSSNTIGGTGFCANIIGSNTISGIAISGTSNLIIGDFIGTDSAADKLGNVLGISITNSSNTIGGTSSTDANTIGYNKTSGISITGSDNVVAGNFVGTDSSGVNLQNVVGIAVGGSNDTIGGATAAAANTIGFNTSAGVSIAAGVSANLIASNFIGTNSAGADLGNPVGVLVGGSSNTIGGAAGVAGNTIGFSTMAGVSIAGTGASGNAVIGNDIGTDANGDAMANVVGIALATTGNTIGGTTASDANVIGLNLGAAISINADGEVVVGNFIGTNAAGTNLGNAVGVSIAGSTNTIGGTAGGAANTIGFSTQQGISVLSGNGNVISENLYDGTNGPASPVQANDISLASNANGSQAAPVLVSAALSSNNILTLVVYEPNASSASQTLEIYLVTSTGRSFQISTSTPLSSSASSPTTVTLTLPADSSLADGDTLVATATDKTNGTSAFSASTFIASPYTVINTSASGSGSLSFVLANANADTSGTAAIVFNIPTTDPNYNSTTHTFTIVVSSALPTVTAAVTIDGSTEPTLPGGQAAVIQINGGGGGYNGLTLDGKGDKVNDLNIVNFGGAGIDIESSGATITDNLIGTDPTGKAAGPGNSVGILINTAEANGPGAATIGGTAASAGNTIGFNTTGISISGTGATGNLIVGNLIGSDAAGDKLGNGIGIAVDTSGNVIGGTTSATANVISSNLGAGISIDANNDLVEGNFIGTNAAGTNLGNAVGISIAGSTNTIGGAASGAANTIGFSTQQGISVVSGNGNVISENLYDGSNGPATPVQTNDISLAPSANGGKMAPILVSAALSGNNLLTLVVYEPNAPSGNQTLEIYLVSSTGPTERSFQISTSTLLSSSASSPTTVTVTLPADSSLADGDMLVATATDTTNGTSAFSASTFIASPYTVINTSASGSGSLSFVLANANADTSGTAPIVFNIPTTDPNYNSATHTFTILVSSALPTVTAAVTIDGSTEPTLPGGQAAVIQINGGGGGYNGLTLDGKGDTVNDLNIVNFGGAGIDIESSGATITDNLIGIKAGGTAAGPGNQVGILIDGGSAATIGGTATDAANTIGFNTAAGISISGAAATGNLIVGNLIGSDAAGDKLGNGIGIAVDTSGNVIGGTTSATANVISSNSGAGISIDANNDLVEGNFIGTNATGTNLGNAVGISIAGSTNTIGGAASGAANTIGFSTQQGISVVSGNGNVISENLYDGTNGPASPVQANDISLASNANGSQAAPVLVSVALSSNNILTLVVYEPNASSAPQTLEIYLVTSTDRSFQISTSTPLSSSASSPTTVTLTLPADLSLADGDTLVATATDTTNGTSAFSASTFIASPYTVINTNDSGSGSLRAAIANSNADPGVTINFNIPSSLASSSGVGGDTFVITLSSALPTITAAVTIDGTTESTFLKLAAVVQLNGGGGAFDGLVLGAGSLGTQITGLDIVNFGDAGIHVESSDDVISDDMLGTDPTGKSAGPGNGTGIFVDEANGGSAATIGGTANSAGNTIGFNATAGILISGASATGNLILGNSINSNAGAGISIDASNDLVLGNDIGSNAVGVSIAGSGNTIGGTATGAANTIGFSTSRGVSVLSGNGNVISGNLYDGTGGPANDISLASGANNGLVAPILESAALTDTTLTLEVYETTAISTTPTLEIYLDTPGQRSFQISQSIALSSDPNNPTLITVSNSALTLNDVLVATVTDQADGTSAFSASTFIAKPYVVINTNDSGSGSLRAAIANANHSTGQTISFAIPESLANPSGSTTFAIMLNSALPTITATMTIDGTTEAASLSVSSAVVQINGGGGRFDGLVVGAFGDTITGLDIVNFGDAGIHVESSGDVISDDMLGTDPTGKSAGPGNGTGIFVDEANGGSAATIGGTAKSAGNTIGFNATAGISISGASTTGSLILGNSINSNAGAGISIDASNDLVLDNDIASNAVGVSIAGSGNTIGGTATGAANTIGFSTSQGVSVLSGNGNVISGNLYDGTGGPTNDISLASGANNGLVAPILESAALTGTTLTIEVYETSAISTMPPPTLEIYLDTPGQRSFQISQSIALSSDPNNPTLITVSNSALTFNDVLVATVTDQADGTSAFSASTFIAKPYVVINTNDSGSGSLRAAITNANRNPGQTISFAIPESLANPPGSATFAIMLNSALPTITAKMTIDGTTEAASLTVSSAVVQINGGGGAFDGLILGNGSLGSQITGLNIVNFGGAGIDVESNSDTITDSLIETDSTGAIAGSGNQVGIFIDDASRATIGGTASSAGNTIGFNQAAGISISGVSATDNLISGNFIGTDSSGDNLGNAVGISINGAGDTIGNLAEVVGNTIGFSTSAGISISGSGDTGCNIIGNFIGTDSAGSDLSNAVGVSINGSENTIGAATSGAGNTIGFSTKLGVSVLSGIGNVISGNLYDGTNGPATPVETNDISVSAGANGNQSPPTIVSAAYDPATDELLLEVSKNAASSNSQTMEIYLEDTGDDQRVFEFSELVTFITDPMPVSVTVSGLSGGDRIVATLTDSTNGTSPFSAAAVIVGPNVVTNKNPAGAGALSTAIMYANTKSGTTIFFDIGGTSPFEIDVTSAALPTITLPTTIDGTTESTYLGQPAVVEIYGDNKPYDGLTLGQGSGGSTIDGLEIVGFGGDGIHVESSDDNIFDNLIGTDGSSSDNKLGNAVGVFVDGDAGGTDAIIGGTSSGVPIRSVSIRQVFRSAARPRPTTCCLATISAPTWPATTWETRWALRLPATTTRSAGPALARPTSLVSTPSRACRSRAATTLSPATGSAQTAAGTTWAIPQEYWLAARTTRSVGRAPARRTSLVSTPIRACRSRAATTLSPVT